MIYRNEFNQRVTSPHEEDNYTVDPLKDSIKIYGYDIALARKMAGMIDEAYCETEDDKKKRRERDELRWKEERIQREKEREETMRLYRHFENFYNYKTKQERIAYNKAYEEAYNSALAKRDAEIAHWDACAPYADRVRELEDF